MNKSEIIERLKKIAEHAVHIAGEAPFDMSLDDGIAVHEAIELLELPPAQPEQRWIPVTERLPEIDKEVLVTDGKLCWVCSLFESPDIEDGLYQWEDNYGHWYEFETWVAWMPLPEIYQEGGEADE